MNTGIGVDVTSLLVSEAYCVLKSHLGGWGRCIVSYTEIFWAL